MSTDRKALERTAREMVAEGKGILAADESNATMSKRLEQVEVEPTEEARRRFRELVFTTEGVQEHISGAILFDETLRQSSSDGVPFPVLLAQRGVIPGIKVDTGASRSPVRRARRSPRAWTVCATGSPSTRRWAPAFASGER